MLKSYVKRIFEVAKRGDAREESYYSCLEELLKNYANSIDKKHIQVTTLPQKTDAGKSLSLDEIKHYCKIVTALKKTIEIQKAIDNIYPEVEKETLSL